MRDHRAFRSSHVLVQVERRQLALTSLAVLLDSELDVSGGLQSLLDSLGGLGLSLNFGLTGHVVRLASRVHLFYLR